MSRWLVTGAGGMLGSDLVDALAGESVTAATRGQLDITDAAACREVVAAAVGPGDAVINAAAWTDVDGAETHELPARRVNAAGVGHLVRACEVVGARLIHVSTDHVFNGWVLDERADQPYAEGAAAAPVNAYGRGKLAGERAVLRGLPDHGYVVRTAWLYGAHGTCFPRTLLRIARERETIEVVDDQRGAPTWSRALAGQLVALGRAAPRPGIYHGTASGDTTWYGLAGALFDELGLDRRRLHPVATDRHPRPARRPSYSVLGQRRWAATVVPSLPDWREMLSHAVAADVFGG
jgi:dTDP-4-dehydrorhamnose reductase